MYNGQDVRTLLGKQVQFFRKKRQLSQAALAERAEISITFLSNIERGVKYPTSDTLSGIANGLGVELHELFKEDEKPILQKNQFERFKIDITKNVIKTLETIYKAYEE